jgi:pilus assembly protein CpaE
MIMVCNRFSTDQRSIISQKDAEKAIGRAFDLLIPEDRALMNDAVAQGCEISSIRTGSKLEKSIGQLANLIIPATAGAGASSEPKRRWRWP